MEDHDMSEDRSEEECVQEIAQAKGVFGQFTENQLERFTEEIQTILSAAEIYPELVKRIYLYFSVVSQPRAYWSRIEKSIELWAIEQPTLSAAALAMRARERFNTPSQLHYLIYILAHRIQHQVRTDKKRQTQFCGWRKYPQGHAFLGVQISRLAWQNIIDSDHDTVKLKGFEPEPWCEVHRSPELTGFPGKDLYNPKRIDE